MRFGGTALPFAAVRDGIRLAVRLTPKAATDRILGVAAAEGGPVLKVAVHAPPQDGKANEALLRLLATVLRLPRRDLTLVLGTTDRRKLVHIAGAPDPLLRHIEDSLRPWLQLA